MNFINLHAHSTWSDGHQSLEEHMFAQRKLGFTACVLTDHIYPEGYDFTLNTEKFEMQCAEAAALQAEYDVPFIIGAEVSVMRMEEICVFGHDAILEILRIKSKGLITKDDLVAIKRDYECVMSLCHPMHPVNFVAHGCMEFLDAYEHVYKGRPRFDGIVDLPPEFSSLVRLSASDAHLAEYLDLGYNESEVPITTEAELIAYIKARRPMKLHGNPRTGGGINVS